MSNKESGDNRPEQEPILDRRRIWLRNVPLLLGLFGTYLFTIGPIRFRADSGELGWNTLVSYALVGVMGIAGSLMVYRRYWTTRLEADADTQSSRAFYLFSEILIYLRGGVGIGFLLMAAIIVVFLV